MFSNLADPRNIGSAPYISALGRSLVCDILLAICYAKLIKVWEKRANFVPNQ